jgi:hypothetical protein
VRLVEHAQATQGDAQVLPAAVKPAKPRAHGKARLRS